MLWINPHAPDERAYDPVELLGRLEVGRMAGFGDDVELRAGDDLRNLFQYCQREYAVLCACDH